MTNFGVLLEGMSAELTVDFAKQAEAAGFARVWIPEITFNDAIVSGTAAALATERIEIGTGVIGIWSRSPVTLAMEAATLNQLSGERLVTGVGTQARGYVDDWHGRRYERPLLAMREYVTILRSILDGNSTTYEGEVFTVRNFQITMAPPTRRAQIHMAAVGPQMIQLAGEIADGILGYLYSVEYLRDVVIPNLKIGAARAGRSLDGFDIGLGLPANVGSESSVEELRGQVVMFATALGSSPAYATSIEAAGFGAEGEEIRERVKAADIPGALAAVTPEMVDALTISGTVDNALSRLAAYSSAGATSLVLNPAAPNAMYPLYSDHLPDDGQYPEFDFPAYLEVVSRTIAQIGG